VGDDDDNDDDDDDDDDGDDNDDDDHYHVDMIMTKLYPHRLFPYSSSSSSSSPLHPSPQDRPPMVGVSFADLVAGRLLKPPPPTTTTTHPPRYYEDLAKSLADAYLFEGRGIVGETLQKEVEEAEQQGGLVKEAIGVVAATAHEYFGQGWDRIDDKVKANEARQNRWKSE